MDYGPLGIQNLTITFLLTAAEKRHTSQAEPDPQRPWGGGSAVTKEALAGFTKVTVMECRLFSPPLSGRENIRCRGGVISPTHCGRCRDSQSWIPDDSADGQEEGGGKRGR
ncbi:hypothetical protein Hypma_007030 [Hypsizygus marmoreus]|uniref:Uncharacterized protein n=1 Tax=Hypsizygus marmoreus TaxID=39966 RepID=A0A369KHH1_HYPMA|nr:hypothetical protein Hypma_007030 [Hypsizygus marmoreus]